MSPLVRNNTTGRISKRGMLARALDVTGCGRMLRSTSVWDGVLTLNYHRIGDRHNSLLDRNLWSATDEDFDSQISTIAREFDVVGLNDLDSIIGKKHGRFVMVTFDDGYLDNYTNAFPILKAHGVTATFFITTGFLDVPKVPWWDDIAWMVRTSCESSLNASRWTSTPVLFDEPDREGAINELLTVYKRLSGEVTEGFLDFLADALKTGRCPIQVANELWMSWDMIREMKQNGMTFGGHTVSHPILANLSAEQQEAEIAPCKQRLIEELGEPIDAFSYPIGGSKSFNDDTRLILEKLSFKWVFAYQGGYCRYNHTDRFAVPRTAIETDVDLPMFRAIATLPQVFA